MTSYNSGYSFRPIDVLNKAIYGWIVGFYLSIFYLVFWGDSKQMALAIWVLTVIGFTMDYLIEMLVTDNRDKSV